MPSHAPVTRVPPPLQQQIAGWRRGRKSRETLSETDEVRPQPSRDVHSPPDPPDEPTDHYITYKQPPARCQRASVRTEAQLSPHMSI